MTGGNAWRYERSCSEKSWERLDLVTQKSEDKRACAFKPTDAQLKPGALMSTESHVTRFWRLEVDFMYVCLVCGLNFSTQLLKLPRLGLLFESG